MRILLIALLAFGMRANAQQQPWEKCTPHSFSGYTEIVSSTFYKSPMIAGMLECSVPIERTKATIICRGGAWINPFITGGNYAIIQVGLYHTFNIGNIKTLDVGGYFMNFQGRAFPRPYYDSIHHAKDEGYLSPFSVFITTKPFKNKALSVQSNFSYYHNINKPSFFVTISYRLFKHDMECK